MRLRPGRWHWGDWVWKAVIPLLAVYFIVMACIDLPELRAASRTEGAPGEFTATRSDCDLRGGCTFYGTFASDDGSIELDDASIDDGVDAVGEVVPAQTFPGSRNDTVYEMGSNEWMWAVLVGVASSLYLVGWAWFMFRPRRSE